MLTHWKTTLAGLAAGAYAIFLQPDVKHAVFGVLLAVLGTVAHDFGVQAK